MPVPTDTFRQQRTLHAVFACSAILLLGSVLWLVLADYTRQWRGYQRQARLWKTAMTTDAAVRAMGFEQERQLRDLEQQIEQLEAQLPHEQIAQISARIEEAQQKKARLALPAATVKGEIGPKIQQVERARLTGSKDVEAIRGQLSQLEEDYRVRELEIAQLDQSIENDQQEVRRLHAERAKTQKKIDDLMRASNAAAEKLAKLDPKGAALLSDRIRNAPLLDWFNPTEKVQQIVTPDIRIDLNFLTVETIDRCNTCHINIDDPAFEENNLLLFVERQLASYEGQDTDSVTHPVVMLPFWESAADLAGLDRQLGRLRQEAFEKTNRVRGSAGLDPLVSDEALAEEFDRIARQERGDDSVTRSQWYAPLTSYLLGLKRALRDSIGDQAFAELRDLYRYQLIDAYNSYRGEQGLAALSANRVMLGHPRLDLFVHTESSHPAKTMGCTSCHEGSGQETDFHHAAHSPADVWVDAESGAAVPRFLLEENDSEGHNSAVTQADAQPAGLSGLSLDGASTAYASPSRGDHHAAGEAGRSSHLDLKLTDPTDPTPFAPVEPPHAEALGYHRPADATADRRAVPMAEYWSHHYGWHSMHYMEWEKPMHERAFFQSSCNKCHTEIFDIDQAAPTLFEGRLLFAQIGCANCHATETLTDDADIKKVGPSLVHLKHKLSSAMTASWIWSPKAFRPTTKMPHYFMLENNSSPVDILRTRTEVAAMTHYLMTAAPAPTAKAYEPEARPEDVAGDPAAGRRLFNSVGCTACHSNLDEQGGQWIVEDLVAREHLAEPDAEQRYESMSYNQRHWYAMEHLADKLERAGPELSAVGTKLKAGRDPAVAQQEAGAWLYDWLRNPQHYSDYSIMPSFRLSPQEASDLAAYLLTLERPGYEPVDFLSLGDDDKRMLAELVAQLKASASTVGMAREAVTAMTTDQQLNYLGKKMVGHYGCNGCHLISGFETAASTCASLDDWGVKDPHKLDFGYFDHAFDAAREAPTTVWKVDHEGLDADAPQVTQDHAKIRQTVLAWEQMVGLERRPWLYHKLHNPRVYDRGRTAYDGYLNQDGGFEVDVSSVGQPYNKLKMPKFFLTDRQVQALVTFVTSLRKPLVSLSVRHATVDDAKMRLIRGRQMATRFNCYGCHNIEGNSPRVWDNFDVFNEDGSFNYDHLNNAPPRLIGQGSKTQPQWLHGFLQNVHELRPWLKVRMPSFELSDDQTTALVDYFAGSSQQIARQLAGPLEAVDKHRASRPDDRYWFESPRLAQAVAHLKAFAVMSELVRPKDLDPQQVDCSQLVSVWDQLLEQARFLCDTNEVPYPYPPVSPSYVDDLWFARGEAVFKELRCYQCHALGDEEKLLALWKLDNPDAGSEPAGDEGGDEEAYGYDDEGYGDEDDYGEDEGYGDDEEDTPAPAGPVYSAPNLSLTALRLNRDWVDRWLQEPGAMQPGTKMPQWFPKGRSAFANYPQQVKADKHGAFGYTGKDQRDLLLDFLYEAGRRNYTPGAERLMGQEPQAVTLPPLPEPPAVEEETTVAGGTTGSDEPAAADAAEKTTQALPVAPKPVEEPKVSAIELHDEPVVAITAQGNGRVVGVVRFEGTPARRRPVRMGADAFCSKSHKGRKVLNESMIVNDDGSMRNVYVYVKSGLSGSFEPSQEPAVIDQVACLYRPHVLGVQAGQPLVILNSDSTLHNVKMASGANGAFNEGMPVAGMQLRKTFSKKELGIQFKCDVHPWMGAFIHVMDHPFFGVSDVEGRFEITGLPPGTYTLEAVHEHKKVSPVTFEVTVDPDTSNRVDVVMD